MSVFQLERTSLHYAMGMEKVETLSTILIKAGAKRVLKDLVSNCTSKCSQYENYSICRKWLYYLCVCSPWWWRRYVPPKRQVLQEPHGVTSQKMPFFTVIGSLQTQCPVLDLYNISNVPFPQDINHTSTSYVGIPKSQNHTLAQSHTVKEVSKMNLIDCFSAESYIWTWLISQFIMKHPQKYLVW
jgi:hypothetical protein